MKTEIPKIKAVRKFVWSNSSGTHVGDKDSTRNGKPAFLLPGDAYSYKQLVDQAHWALIERGEETDIAGDIKAIFESIGLMEP